MTSTGFGRPVRPPRAPRGFGRPAREPFLKRTASALKDSARDRAELARRKIATKLTGRKHTCRCGKTFYTQTGRDACVLRHQREARTKASTRNRTKAAPKAAARPGHHSCAGCGKRFRNDLELNDHARQHAEREDRAEARRTERGRRTDAVNERNKRGGRPKGTPKNRERDGRTRDERRAEWHAHRMQHAAGRVDRDGNRTPHPPSPRTVRPKVRVAPKPK